jgi:hypothetical protein
MIEFHHNSIFYQNFGLFQNLAERSEQISYHTYQSLQKAFGTTLEQTLQCFFLSKISHTIFIFIYISSVVLWAVFVLSSKSLSPTFLTYECQQENKFTWRLFAATERTLMVIRSGKFVDERLSFPQS